MSLEKWELTLAPSDKDRNRWRLKVKIDEESLQSLVSALPAPPGRQFRPEDEGFDFGFDFSQPKEREIADMVRLLKERCPDGTVHVPRKDEELDSLLEKVAQGIEKTFDHSGGQAGRPDDVPPAEDAAASFDNTFQDLELNPRYTFEEFVVGPNNRFTAAAAQAVADNLGKIYNPFFIYSSVGLGKTHLMHAVGHYVRKKTPSLRILYVTTEKFMSEVIDSIRQGTLRQMREHYRQIDLLLVDDIQFLVESESTQEEFFHTFNVLHQNGKQIIITSDRPPKQLTTLEDRLRSRFEWGLIADIKAPNLETRVAILKKKEEIDKLTLTDNILLYIASKLKSNIRELEGFLKRINAYASLTHQEVNMDLVRSLMSDLLPAEELDDAPAQQRSGAPVPEAVASPPPAEPPAAPAPRPEPALQPPPPPAEAPIVPEDIVIQTSVPQPQKAPPPRPAMSGENGDMKSVEVAFFFPQAKNEELGRVKERFSEVIRKHKLKFHLQGVVEESYECGAKLNYAAFAELCKKNSIGIAIVLGPPPDCPVAADDFAGLLSAVMEDERISLQLVPWAELGKDYRYLNLALDITLLKHKS